MYGYVDRDGDGYRETPDGSPLVLQNASTPSARDQQIDELWKRSMDDVGLKMTFKKAKWPDLLKESNAGKLMMWQLGGAASSPDADTWLIDPVRPERRASRATARASGSTPTTGCTRRRA